MPTMPRTYGHPDSPESNPAESKRDAGRLKHMANLSILAFIFLPTVLQAPPAQAQDVQAPQVAAAVQAFYNQSGGVKASFYQTYVHKLYQKTDRSKGTVTFVKPGKMRWDYAKPNGKVIVSDENSLRVFEPGEDGDEPQLFESQISQESLPAAFSFLTGTGKLEQDFTFRLVSSKKAGFEQGLVLEMRPRKPSPQYERVLLYVLAKDGKPTGIVQRVLIVDNQGNRNRFDFSGFQWNPKTGKDTFKLKVPEGTRRIRT